MYENWPMRWVRLVAFDLAILSKCVGIRTPLVSAVIVPFCSPHKDFTLFNLTSNNRCLVPRLLAMVRVQVWRSLRQGCVRLLGMIRDTFMLSPTHSHASSMSCQLLYSPHDQSSQHLRRVGWRKMSQRALTKIHQHLVWRLVDPMRVTWSWRFHKSCDASTSSRTRLCIISEDSFAPIVTCLILKMFSAPSYLIHTRLTSNSALIRRGHSSIYFNYGSRWSPRTRRLVVAVVASTLSWKMHCRSVIACSESLTEKVITRLHTK